jgi:hypothetical protein
MQPQPTEVSLNTQSVAPISEQTEHSQHGIHHEHDQASSHLLGGGDGPEPDISSNAFDAPERGDPVSPQPRITQTSGLGWLNDDSRPKATTPVNRISQYEQALTPSPRKSPDIVGFKVIQSTKRGSGTPLSDFPNGKRFDLYCARKVPTTDFFKRCSLMYYRTFHLNPYRQSPLYPPASIHLSPLRTLGESHSRDFFPVRKH